MSLERLAEMVYRKRSRGCKICIDTDNGMCIVAHMSSFVQLSGGERAALSSIVEVAARNPFDDGRWPVEDMGELGVCLVVVEP